jgi:hypothetical protein
MRQPPPPSAPSSAPAGGTPYLTNAEAAEWLRLSPRTLEKLRVIGGGPRFRKLRRRVVYAVADLEAWSNSRAFEMTSDPNYNPHGESPQQLVKGNGKARFRGGS